VNADIADAFDAGAWEFTPEVVAEFDRHVRQSVPFYDVIQDAVAELSDWLAPTGSRIVDLGVSTGETFRRILDRHPDRDYDLIGYDTSEKMIDAARSKLAGVRSAVFYPTAVEDGLVHSDARLTTALFTLQFIPPELRPIVLRMAHTATRPDGAILVAEKVRAVDARWFEIGTEVSWDVKAAAGIPDTAIRSKARALRGVLRPLTEAENLGILAEAGWVGSTVIFRWHQWCLFGGFAS
jgi:tRNA (cmo5U34)-methyltransferase